jgi:signal peptidase complex subunit 2
MTSVPGKYLTLFLPDLKNTSDDAIPNYLNSLKFKQSHSLTDVRLALGYSAFIVAAACFLWDYKFGFQDTKYFTAGAVALYSVLNGGLTIWLWLVERGTVYIGTAPSGETLRISTSTRKNVPQYDVQIEIFAPGKSSNPETTKISRSFTEWFDVAGHFVAPPFQSMLAMSVPCVGKLDPKRVPAQSETYTPEMLDILAKASMNIPVSAPESTGAETSAKKAGKRRK